MPTCRLKRILALAAALGSIITSPGAQAAPVTATWATGDSGTWTDGTHWIFSPGTASTFPTNTVADTFNVFIDGGGAGNSTVDLNATVTIDTLNVSGGDTLNLGNGQVMSVAKSSVVNDGTIDMNAAAGFATYLTLVGDAAHTAAIGGTGTIVMGDNANNRITGSGSPILTNDTGHTIRGAGRLLDNTAGMINKGTIIADGTNTLVVEPGTLGFVNQGTVQATGTGGLEFYNGSVTNTGHTIEIMDSSKLQLQGMTLTGGTLQTSGSGYVFTGPNGNFTLDGVTVDGPVQQANGSVAQIYDGLTHSGTWNLNATINPTTMVFHNSQTIGGTGTIVMGDNPLNVITGSGSPILTNDIGHTIRGAGQLLDNGAGMINKGTIIADGTNTLVVEPGSLGFVNQGTVRATGAGGLEFYNGSFTNTGHTIEIMDGSKLELQGMTLTGGTLQTSGSGYIFTGNGGNFTLDGVTVNGPVQQANFSSVQIYNGLTHSGTWNLNAAANPTTMAFHNSQTIGGTGTIVMGDNANNRITGSGAPILTNDTGHTIRGAGQLLYNSAGMINLGTIIADGTNTLVVNPGSLGFVNQGTVQATGAGGLEFTNGSFTNTGHTIEIMDGSKLELQGMTLTGGTLQTSGSGYVFTGDHGNFALDGVTVNGPVQQANGSGVQIYDGLTHSGTWNLNAAANPTTMAFHNSQTIGGTGTIVMGDSPFNVIDGSGSPILTNDTGHTIRGAGQLLYNSAGMINLGTIIADGTNTLVVNPGSLGFVNQGTVQATGAGGLEFTNGSFTNTGHTIEIMDGSKLQLQGMTLTGGTLQTSGSGYIFTGAGGNFTLDGVTVNGPVQQANFSAVNIHNGLAHNSTWNLNATINPTVINFEGGDQTLDGTGTIFLGNNALNVVEADNATTLTQASGHTIRGAGTVLNGAGGLINQGTIIADQATAMTIKAGGGRFVNRGTVMATGTGGIDLRGSATFAANEGDVMIGHSRIDVTNDYVQTAGHTALQNTDSVLTTTGTVQLQGGRLSGIGTVTGNVNNTGGTLAPGNSPGILTIQDGDYVQASAAAFEYQLFGPNAGTGHDLLKIVNGNADLAGSLMVLADQAYAATLHVGDTFEVIDITNGGFLGAGSLDQAFDSLSVDLAGLDFDQFLVSNGSDNSLWLRVTQADAQPPGGGTVPTPATLPLLLTGLGGLMAVRKRRRA